MSRFKINPKYVEMCNGDKEKIAIMTEKLATQYDQFYLDVLGTPSSPTFDHDYDFDWEKRYEIIGLPEIFYEVFAFDGWLVLLSSDGSIMPVRACDIKATDQQT